MSARSMEAFALLREELKAERLVKADLLAACEALVAGVEDSVIRFLAEHDQRLRLRPDMETILLARLDRARAAIAKARAA